MSMWKSKPEFKRMPQVQQYYDVEDTFGVASRRKNIDIIIDMFSEQEQEEIINQFLGFIKVTDYKPNSKLKRKNCKCNDYKKHHKYCVLNELPIPENILNNIYSFTCSCYDCEKKVKAEEILEERAEANDLFLFNVDKLFLSVSEIFPCYDIVQTIIKNITPRRHRKLEQLFNEIMDCITTTKRDFDKIIRRCFDKPNFDLLE